MRILVATDQWSPDVVGGSARVAADTSAALARRGHDVTVLAPAQPTLPAIEVSPGVEVRRVLRRGRVPQTVADPVETYRQARKLRSRSFDVLVAHQATTAAGLARARLDAPTALVFHASPVLELRWARKRITALERIPTYALEPLLVALERRAIRGSRDVLVLSSFSAGILRDRFGPRTGRIHVVGGGVDDSFFAAPHAPDECRMRLGIPPGRLLLTARRLEPRMGIENLVEALTLIGDEDLQLAIAGTGSRHDAILRRVEQLGLVGRVHLLGRLPEDDLRSLYAAAELFVLPSLAYEGFGMSTVEALAAGTPALGTAVGATPEILGELGSEFVVETPDPAALAAAIRRILPQLGPSLRARAHTLAERRYRWDTAILRWEQALTEIARR